MIPTPKRTRHKFYNKWLYKTTLSLEGGNLLRLDSRKELDDFLNCDSAPRSVSYNIWKSRAWNARHDMKTLLEILDSYDDTLWSTRIESGWIDVYTNEKSLYDKISKKLGTLLVHRFEPDIEKIDLLNDRNGKTMLVKKLPQGRFNYRVYLLPHTLKNKEDEKERFLEWLEAQKPRVTCTDSIKAWFRKNKTNWDRRYVLVEDEGTLMMMKLRNPDVVGTVYKFEIE